MIKCKFISIIIFNNIISMKNSQLQKVKWIEAPQKLQLQSPFLKARPIKPIGSDVIEYEAQTSRGKLILEIHNSSAFLTSNGDLYDDMCEMDILNQPEVLHNLVQRYKKDKIFTFIGPTLIIINPYRMLPQYFSNQIMLAMRKKIIDRENFKQPHIYYLAGNAYTSMVLTRKKQAIVISGESGAGKTQSTKYCMQILTSLSHKQTHPIEAKILACNPILEAFGNSKTLRNDNSSRFGKYVQIYFASDNTIIGANIVSYLLQKSRVVSVAQGQRSFHIFYALIASQIKSLSHPSYYKYLKQSQCYEANNIDDEKYFHEIVQAMKNIGFSQAERQRIWDLLACILEFGNVEFDDKMHNENESKPCLIKNKQSLFHLGKCLDIHEEELQKILLYEKKQFLKQFTYSPYNKDKCHGNIATLSKAIYNAVFEFIIHKIQLSLKSKSAHGSSSINILDIFGFQNFATNSFEQFCINFTNQKLLKLYNKYIFEKEMEILKSDGLEEEVKNIHPPSNDEIINIISGSLSLFSIINDFTMPQQYKDSDIIRGFEGKLKSPHLTFDKINKSKFTIAHSQCSVNYIIDSFKQKNQDKVLPEIAGIVTKFFSNQNKEQAGKTILSKFSKEIDVLVDQLGSSKVHFIRCIKPNEEKMPNLAEQVYILAQVRYLGIFETIQIRKKTFPARWLYKQFIEQYSILFPGIKGISDRSKTQNIMKILSSNSKQYLFGKQRVYMSMQIDNELSKRLYVLMKQRIESGKKIWKSYKKFKYRKEVLKKLKILVKRIKIWKKLAQIFSIKIQQENFKILCDYSKKKKKEIGELEIKKKIQLQKQRQNASKLKNERIESNIKEFFEKYSNFILHLKNRQIKKHAFLILKAIRQNLNINDTVFVDDPAIQQYERNIPIQKDESKQQEFNQTFLDQSSISFEHNNKIAFEKTMPVDFYKGNPKLQKFKLILADRYQVSEKDMEDDSYFSPNSKDSEFQLEDTAHEILNKIISFPTKEFYKRVLRKRTNFIGMSKNEDEILVAKNRALSKSLTILNEGDEHEALKIFKFLIKIGEQTKLDKVFKLIEDMMNQLQGTSMHVKNQIFLGIIKQTNTDVELSSVRILQCLSVFLHVYCPDYDFLYAGMNFFYLKIAQKRYTERQAECIRYVFRKMVRKIEKPVKIAYMPVKYQMIALMCRRKITVPVFFPIGDRIFINIEPYETFGDLKIRILQEFGIDWKRINPEYFTFFEVVNYENQEIDESPINENDLAWDVVAYWERAKIKYDQTGVYPPNFFLMVKVRYVYECMVEDEETIQLFYAQCYFDYFIGRIKLPLDRVSCIAACIKLIKFFERSDGQSLGSFPAWVRNTVDEEKLIVMLRASVKTLIKNKPSQTQIKFIFLQICSECPLAMSMAIPTEQNVKLFLKPKKLYLADKNEIIEEISIKNIVKWAVDDDKFLIQMRGEQKKTQGIFTEFSKICSSYISRLPSLLKHNRQILNEAVLNEIK